MMINYSFWMMWFMLSILTLYFILKIKNISQMIFYLIIQEVSIIFFFFFIFIWNKIFVILLLMKMGFPPFHFWILNLMMFLNNKNFIFFLTYMKILPLMILVDFIDFNQQKFMFLMIFSVMLLFKTELLKMLIFLSSSISIFFFMIYTLFSKTNLKFLMMFYIFFIYYLMNKNKNMKPSVQLNFFFMMMLINFPISFYFMFKLFILATSIYNFLVIFILVILFLVIINYFKYIYFTFYMMNDLFFFFFMYMFIFFL